jgi:hypothetical protein
MTRTVVALIVLVVLIALMWAMVSRPSDPLRDQEIRMLNEIQTFADMKIRAMPNLPEIEKQKLLKLSTDAQIRLALLRGKLKPRKP